MTPTELLQGAKILAESVFGKKKEYHLQFNHESDGCWYINYPNWPLDHHNLMMVSGSDKLCEFLSKDNKFTYVSVIPTSKLEQHSGYFLLTRKEMGILEGATYEVSNLKGFNEDIWICPVTLAVLGEYPKYIYIKNEIRTTN